MHAGLTVKQAIEAVELEMGIPIAVAQGFDAREFGSKTVNVLWYAFPDRELPGHRRPASVSGAGVR